MVVHVRSVCELELDAAGDIPSGRYHHSMTVLADGTAVLFGFYDDFNKLNDVWTLSVSETNASWASLNSQGDTPGGRDRHSMTALAGGTAVLFGGYDGSSDLDDVWTLSVSGTTASWVSLTSAGDTPNARYGHSMTVLADGTAVLFGGYGYGFLNDVYKLTVSGSGASWASLNSAGDTPSGRYVHSMTALVDGRAVLFGGYSYGYLNDAWTHYYLYDVYTLSVSGTTASWTSLNSTGDTPGGRYGHSMTALVDGRAVLSAATLPMAS